VLVNNSKFNMCQTKSCNTMEPLPMEELILEMPSLVSFKQMFHPLNRKVRLFYKQIRAGDLY
jgi:hypothetical protein